MTHSAGQLYDTIRWYGSAHRQIRNQANQSISLWRFTLNSTVNIEYKKINENNCCLPVKNPFDARETYPKEIRPPDRNSRHGYIKRWRDIRGTGAR